MLWYLSMRPRLLLLLIFLAWWWLWMLLSWLWRMHGWSEIVLIHFAASSPNRVLLELRLTCHSFLWLDIRVHLWFWLCFVTDWLILELVFVIFVSIILSMRNLIDFWSSLFEFLASATLARGWILLIHILILDILYVDRLLTLVAIILTKLRLSLLLSHLPLLLRLLLGPWCWFVYWIIDFNVIV